MNIDGNIQDENLTGHFIGQHNVTSVNQDYQWSFCHAFTIYCHPGAQLFQKLKNANSERFTVHLVCLNFDDLNGIIITTFILRTGKPFTSSSLLSAFQFRIHLVPIPVVLVVKSHLTGSVLDKFLLPV